MRRAPRRDRDDTVEIDWLASFAEVFRAHPDCDVVCCGVVDVDSATGSVLAQRLPGPLGPAYQDQQGLFTQGGTYALRRTLFFEVGGFDEDMPASQHTEFALRLTPLCSQRGRPIRTVSRPLVRRTLHGGPSIRKNDADVLAAVLRLLERHEPALRKSPRELANHCATGAVRAYRIGKREVARALLMRAIKADPTRPMHWARLVLAYLSPLAERVWRRSDMSIG